jgi:antirestriction protein ArdC
MDVVSTFNNLHGKQVSRERLKKILTNAQIQEHPLIVKRINNLLNQNKETRFLIEIQDFIDVSGLSGTEQNIILPSLEYHSEDDAEGLNGVSQDDIYSYITELILNTIEKVGHLPWQKDWIGSGSEGTAKNYVSKKEYSGVNFLLNFDVKFDEDGRGYLVLIKFTQPYYLTFNQIKEAKASLVEGSKARRVIYYTMIFNYDNGALKFKTTDKKKFTEFVKENNITKEDLKQHLIKIPIVKYYNVYRADHCTGLVFESDKIKTKKVNPITEAQSIIDGYKNPPTYTFIGDKAYYQPVSDTLNMPKIEAFKSEAGYYSTFFHEMTHSTGHSKRLDRGNDTRVRDGSKKDKQAYAFEELVAELGAVFLCAESGILFHTRDNSAKYLKGWNNALVNELENDNRFFLKASAKAQKAVNLILDKQPEEVSEEKVRKVRKTKVKIIKKPVKKGNVSKTKTGLSIVKVARRKPIVPQVKKEIKKENSSINKLEKLGFVSADSAPKQAEGVFVLGGEIGKFLQKQQPHKALILIKGNKHSSKSQLAMQIANAFGEAETPVAYIDYEQGGIESKDTVDSIARNTTEKGRKYIAIKGYLEKPFEELQDFCKVVKVIIADSVTDLKITADQLNELRTKYPKIIWCFISQVKENGAMYGGNKMAHNPTSVIHCSSHEDPKQRFATLEKNRGNDISLKYSMYHKKVVTKTKLSFNVN